MVMRKGNPERASGASESVISTSKMLGILESEMAKGTISSTVISNGAGSSVIMGAGPAKAISEAMLPDASSAVTATPAGLRAASEKSVEARGRLSLEILIIFPS